MLIIERLFSIMSEKNVKSSELCSYLGITSSTVANWKTRKTDPPAKYIIPICEFLGIAPHLLLTGEDSYTLDNSSTDNIAPMTEDETDLLSYFRNLPRKDQRAILVHMENILESNSVAADDDKDDTTKKSLA